MKKWVIVSIIIFLMVIVAVYLFTVFIPSRTLTFSRCSKPINLFCTGENSSISKDKIPCKNDNDCKSPVADTFCTPDMPSWTDCIGEKDYCGQDGFCKQCQCNP